MESHVWQPESDFTFRAQPQQNTDEPTRQHRKQEHTFSGCHSFVHRFVSPSILSCINRPSVCRGTARFMYQIVSCRSCNKQGLLCHAPSVKLCRLGVPINSRCVSTSEIGLLRCGDEDMSWQSAETCWTQTFMGTECPHRATCTCFISIGAVRTEANNHVDSTPVRVNWVLRQTDQTRMKSQLLPLGRASSLTFWVPSFLPTPERPMRRALEIRAAHTSGNDQASTATPRGKLTNLEDIITEETHDTLMSPVVQTRNRRYDPAKPWWVHPPAAITPDSSKSTR